MSTLTVTIPCATAVVVMNEIEARQAAFQLVVSCEYKPGHQFIEFELWENGASLPHSLRLNSDGAWQVKTEVQI